MTYDCFTFFNELDLLEIRLNTLSGVVDYFVIAEATRTYTGKPKELLFDRNRERYANFLDRIRYVVVDNLLSENEVAKDSYNLTWVNENRQRNALIKGLEDAHNDDIVLLSDMDEIPRPLSILKAKEELQKNRSSVRLEMRSYNFYINFENYTCSSWLLGTIVVKYGDFIGADLTRRVECDRYTQKSENSGSTLQKLRFLKSELIIDDAGWHFSFLGGIDAIQRKLEAFSHSEFGSVPREMLEMRLRSGNDLFGRNGRFFGVPIDSSFPEFIVENQLRFSGLLFPVDDEYMRRTKFARMFAKIRGVIYRLIVKLVPDCFALTLVRARDSIMKRLGRI